MNQAEMLLLNSRCVAHLYDLSSLNFTHMICKRQMLPIAKKYAKPALLIILKKTKEFPYARSQVSASRAEKTSTQSSSQLELQ